jgi:hypothetical protein
MTPDHHRTLGLAGALTDEPPATRDRVRRAVRPWGLAAITAATLYLLVAGARADPGAGLFNTVPLWYLVPGVIVVLRRDGQVIGWLLLANALGWAAQFSTEIPGGGLAWMPVAWRAWTNYWIGYIGWIATIALFVLFPDGLADRTPRQRRVGRAMIAPPVLVMLAAMLTTPVGDGEMFRRLYANPTGLGFIPRTVGDVLVGLIVVVGFGSVIGVWRRARRVTGVQRLQYRWVLFAFAVVMVGLVIGLTLSEVVGEAAWWPIVVGWLLIPTAFAIAILRHRLYDIDRVISRTVAYAVITAVVASIYAATVVALPELFDLRGPLPVAAATLAAAAAFSPVRRVVQRWVDRHFNRARFDARRELDAFAARLRSQVELDTIVADITTLVGTTLQPSTATTWIRPARRRS